jgi:hypothetical protein
MKARYCLERAGKKTGASKDARQSFEKVYNLGGFASEPAS